MITPWKVFDSGSASAKRNMDLDVALLEDMSLPEACPTLHLYDWESPSATYGHFIDPMLLLKEGAAGLQLAKRPTGGGVIFHISDWAFSVLVPATHSAYSVNTLDNYAFVNAMIIELVGRFAGNGVKAHLLATEMAPTDTQSRHFCMAKPTKYDVMVDGYKVGGGAQRRTKHGFLHQGTISLAHPGEVFLEKVLLPGTAVADAMRQHTCALLPGIPTAQQIAEARQNLKHHFIDILKN